MTGTDGGHGAGEERYERFQQAVEAPMLVASLIFIPLLVVPWLVDLSHGVEQAMAVGTWLIWALFVAEYLGLLYLAPDRWHMVRTHVLDLVIIVVPFLRPLRALRLLRLVAVAGRAGQATRRLTGRTGFRWFLAFVLSIIVVGGILVYGAEQREAEAGITSVEDGLWWALVTTTTVGYGDEYPVSTEGRAVAAVLMLVGISLISVVTANVAAYFVATEDDGLREVADRLARIEAELQRGAGPGEPPDRTVDPETLALAERIERLAEDRRERLAEVLTELEASPRR